MLFRNLRRGLVLTFPLLSFAAPAQAADKPTIGFVVPTLDAHI